MDTSESASKCCVSCTATQRCCLTLCSPEQSSSLPSQYWRGDSVVKNEKVQLRRRAENPNRTAGEGMDAIGPAGIPAVRPDSCRDAERSATHQSFSAVDSVWFYVPAHRCVGGSRGDYA